MFRLGFWAQVILPHPARVVEGEVTALTCCQNWEAKKRADSCIRQMAPLMPQTVLKDAAVNTDTVELLLGFTNETTDVATQTPVEFYFHLDFDLHGDGHDEAEDVVDGLGSVVKTELQLNAEEGQTLGKQLRTVADAFSQNYRATDDL